MHVQDNHRVEVRGEGSAKAEERGLAATAAKSILTVAAAAAAVSLGNGELSIGRMRLLLRAWLSRCRC